MRPVSAVPAADSPVDDAIQSAEWLDQSRPLRTSAATRSSCPASVFALSRRQVALFLHHLWATDGSLGMFKLGDGDRARIYYTSTSRRLIDEFSSCLLAVRALTAHRHDAKG